MKDHLGEAARRRHRFLGALFALLAGWAAIESPVAGQDVMKPVDPAAREFEVNSGIVDFERGFYERALERLNRAEVSQSGPAYYRGLSLLALQRAEDALREFDAIRMRPGAPAEVELDAGVAELSTGDLTKAEATLAKYVRGHPSDPYGHYFLGVALFRQKRHDDALNHFKLASTDASLAKYLDFYQGMSAYARGDADFRTSLARYGASGNACPSTDLARRLAPAPASRGLVDFSPKSTATGRPGDPTDRRWNLAFLNGYEYDTNVALAPSLTPLGLGSTGNLRDSRYVLAAFGDYRVVQNEEWVLGLLGSVYSSFQFDRTQFNLQDYMGGAYSNLALGDRFILGTRYEFHETLLNGHQFATDHRLTPNLTFREGTFGHTTAFYEYEALGVTGQALVPAQVRSGDIHSVGATQAIYLFEGAGRLFFGYRHDQASTAGSDFDRRTDMVNARVEAPLPYKSVGFVEYRHFWDDYLNPNSLDFFGRPRTDRRSEARVGTQTFFTPKISLLMEYTYLFNDSNVENLFGASFYSYDRHVLSTMLVYDF